MKDLARSSVLPHNFLSIYISNNTFIQSEHTALLEHRFGFNNPSYHASLNIGATCACKKLDDIIRYDFIARGQLVYTEAVLYPVYE